MVHNMRMRLLLFFLLLITILHGCGTGPRPPSGDETAVDAEYQARQFLQSGSYNEAAAEYLRLADADKKKANPYRLKAAAAYMEGKNFGEARKILDMTKPDPKETVLVSQKIILLAKLELELGQPGEALRLTNITLPGEVPRSMISAFHEIRARAWYENNNFLDAARERLVLSAYLDIPEETKDNYVRIWESILRMELPTLEEARSSQSDTMGSWIELAILYKTMRFNAINFRNAVEAWNQRSPGHPAYTYIVPDLIAESEKLDQKPRHIALLLPFSGQYQRAAEAIRDGFLAAWFASGETQKPVVTVHNANVININDAYQQAVDGGADIVVGPLEKEAIATLVEQGNITVTTLVLNEYKSSGEKPTGIKIDPPQQKLYQFSLSPIDEANEVAERAWFDGHILALTLTPDTPWGNRIHEAFKTRWQQLGGEILEHETFSNEIQDFAEPVRSLLNIDSSEQRAKLLTGRLGRKLKTESRRRQDADFIFIAATPVAARQLIPQIRYYRADDLPVYSTSHVFSGILDLTKDNDINGINFVDIPWILDSVHEVSLLQQSLNRLWSQDTSSYRRLYALGIDSYHLIPELGVLSTQTNKRFDGETGQLSMLPDGRIERHLIWAKFVDGRPIPLDGNATAPAENQ